MTQAADALPITGFGVPRHTPALSGDARGSATRSRSNNLQPAPVDQVLASPYILINPAVDGDEVSGVEPAVFLQLFIRFLGVPPIAFQNVRPRTISSPISPVGTSSPVSGLMDFASVPGIALPTVFFPKFQRCSKGHADPASGPTSEFPQEDDNIYFCLLPLDYSSGISGCKVAGLQLERSYLSRFGMIHLEYVLSGGPMLNRRSCAIDRFQCCSALKLRAG